MEDKRSVPYVIGPDGEKMTRTDLPAPDTQRWVPRRKARVVAAVEGGLISEEEALTRYAISPEEFAFWRKGLRSFGMRGLKVTEIARRRTASE